MSTSPRSVPGTSSPGFNFSSLQDPSPRPPYGSPPNTSPRSPYGSPRNESPRRANDETTVEKIIKICRCWNRNDNLRAIIRYNTLSEEHRSAAEDFLCQIMGIHYSQERGKLAINGHIFADYHFSLQATRKQKVHALQALNLKIQGHPVTSCLEKALTIQSDIELDKAISIEIRKDDCFFRDYYFSQNPSPYHIRSETCLVGRYQVAIASSQGARKSMEDRHVVGSVNFKSADGTPHRADVFMICDGHGGSDAAEFLKAYFINRLKVSLEQCNYSSHSKTGVWHALLQTFESLDREYTGNSGSTAAVLLIVDDQTLFCVNLGDSEIALNKARLTRPQKSHYSDLMKGFMRRGGKINIESDEQGDRYYILEGYDTLHRVHVSIGMARAFGDHNIKGVEVEDRTDCILSHVPKISFIDVAKIHENWEIRLSTDGFYDFCDPNLLEEVMAKDTASLPEKMVQNAVRAALLSQESSAYNGSANFDNVTLMIVRLNSSETVA